MDKVWLWSVLVYYFAVNAIVPRISCQWPFHRERLWCFGVIPLALAIIGLSIYRSQRQRVIAWVVFALAVTGICISFQPWCLKIGLNTW